MILKVRPIKEIIPERSVLTASKFKHTVSGGRLRPLRFERTFTIVKVFYHPRLLAEHVKRLGFKTSKLKDEREPEEKRRFRKAVCLTRNWFARSMTRSG